MQIERGRKLIKFGHKVIKKKKKERILFIEYKATMR